MSASTTALDPHADGAGYRPYSEEDVRRLYRIAALRDLVRVQESGDSDDLLGSTMETIRMSDRYYTQE